MHSLVLNRIFAILQEHLQHLCISEHKVHTTILLRRSLKIEKNLKSQNHNIFHCWNRARGLYTTCTIIHQICDVSSGLDCKDYVWVLVSHVTKNNMTRLSSIESQPKKVVVVVVVFIDGLVLVVDVVLPVVVVIIWSLVEIRSVIAEVSLLLFLFCCCCSS